MQRLILALTIVVLVEVTGVPSALAQQASAASVRVTDFGFLSNDGLLAGDARLFMTDASAVIGLTSDGGSVAIGKGQQTLRWRFEGADPYPQMAGHDPLPGEVNFLHTSDPSQWRTGMQSFAPRRLQQPLSIDRSRRHARRRWAATRFRGRARRRPIADRVRVWHQRHRGRRYGRTERGERIDGGQ